MAKKIFKTVAHGLVGGVVGATASLFSKKKKPDAATAQNGPQVMPLADDARLAAVRRRSIAGQLNRSGRSSTMLTADSDTLGG